METQYRPIEILAGVDTDRSETKTQHYTYADKIRFVNGIPEKIGGITKSLFDYSDTIEGTVRSLFAEVISGKYYSLAGTNKKLYSIFGSRLTNITPFQSSSVSATDFETHYDTLGANPLSAVSGSSAVTITDPDASKLEAGDTVYISGAAAFAGLTTGDLNGDAVVRSIGAGSFSIDVGVNATSTETGGGSSVTRASGLVTINATSHGMVDKDRTKIEGATATGGIDAADINIEAIIRNVEVNSFDVMTQGEPTSSATGGAIDYYLEITEGSLNEGNSFGYGAGLYGGGLYGTARASDSARALPRIWFADRYGTDVVLTAGNQTPVYQWGTSNETAPEPVVNAPTAVNYAFVSNNILVLFGESNVENRITGSDQNDITNYVSSSTNQVFRDDIEGAGRLLSHVPVEDYNLIFTDTQTYKFRYIGLPAIWQIEPIDEAIGIISPMARASAGGIGFWQGQENFYMYRGGTVEVIPSNSGTESTVHDYIFDDLNWGQKSKCFAWFNPRYNEIWFHSPSAGSSECDRAAVVNLFDFSWTIHQFNRTAAEYPNVKLKTPRLANAGNIFQHENGFNDCEDPLEFTLTSNKRYYGRDNVTVQGLVPDSVTNNDVTFTDAAYLYPQSSTPVKTDTITITNTTERVPVSASSRYHQYTWAGSELGQSWKMGEWLEEIQKGANQ